jgi:hypothetical protein
MWRGLPIILALLTSTIVARADGAPNLEQTAAFEQAYGLSFYVFDACGDGLAGRVWRRALTERLAQCPFSTEAKERFARRSTAQRLKSSKAIQGMIDEHGGLPVRLDGMSQTCHEQMDSPEYRSLRARLDRYAAGQSPLSEVITAPCDATTIVP